MNRGLPAALLVISLATGGIALSDRVAARAVSPGGPTALPLTAAAEVPICPGPETLVAPEGATAVDAPGPVHVFAVAAPSSAGSGGEPGADVLAVALGTSSTRSDPGPEAVTGTGVPAGAALVSVSPEQAGALRTYTAEKEPVPAVAASQWTLARDGDLRGLATLSCQVAGTDQWLVGGGTQDGRRARLLLTNPSSAPAVVDLTIYGPSGIVQTPAASGIVVPAGGQKALYVDALAPGLLATAVRVRAGSGRVSAVMHDSLLRGTVPGGTDDIVPAAGPARRQLVPGISVTATGSGQQLPVDSTAAGAVAVRVVAPEAVDAVVRIHLYGPDGELELPGGGVTTVPGRSLTDVPLVGIPDGIYTAVVESDTPIVSGAVVGRFATPSVDDGSTEESPEAGSIGWDATDGAPEFGWAAATRTITSLTAVALPVPEELWERGRGRPADTHVQLVLAGTGSAAGTRVTWVGLNGQIRHSQDITIDSGQTVAVTVPDSAVGFVLRPGSGTGVVAAVVVSVDDPAGELISVEPVRPGRIAGRAAPDVVEDPRAGLFPVADPSATG
jgi:hypothetical protein